MTWFASISVFLCIGFNPGGAVPPAKPDVFNMVPHEPACIAICPLVNDRRIVR